VARELIAKVAYKQDVYELGTWLEEQHNELRKYSVKLATLPIHACLTNSAIISIAQCSLYLRLFCSNDTLVGIALLTCIVSSTWLITLAC
jgi:hypothetical protein